MRFKTTENIFKGIELYGTKHLDFSFETLPPKINWDYSRELQIEDIDIWEVIYEGFSGTSLYAAWCPYAEFYMFVYGLDPATAKIETHYGKGAQKAVQKKVKELDVPIATNKLWVDADKMWLYEN